jgi:hypothetical protein
MTPPLTSGVWDSLAVPFESSTLPQVIRLHHSSQSVMRQQKKPDEKDLTSGEGKDIPSCSV